MEQPIFTPDKSDVPFQRTLEEIETSKSNYRRARQQLFSRLHKHSISKMDEMMLTDYLKRILDEAEWQLDITKRFMKNKPADYKLNKELLVYFRSFDYDCNQDELGVLDKKLEQFEELSGPYIDVWNKDEADLLLDAPFVFGDNVKLQPKKKNA